MSAQFSLLLVKVCLKQVCFYCFVQRWDVVITVCVSTLESLCKSLSSVGQTAKLRYITSVQNSVFLDKYSKQDHLTISPSPTNANKSHTPTWNQVSTCVLLEAVKLMESHLHSCTFVENQQWCRWKQHSLRSASGSKQGMFLKGIVQQFLKYMLWMRGSMLLMSCLA